MSGVKKVVDVASKAGKAIDWDGMAKMLVSDEARKEFANLRRAFDEVNPTLQTKFSQGFCASHRIDDAFELLSQMESDDCRPNAHTLTVLIHGLCKEKRLADAEVLLSESFGRAIESMTLINACKVARAKMPYAFLFVKNDDGDMVAKQPVKASGSVARSKVIVPAVKMLILIIFQIIPGINHQVFQSVFLVFCNNTSVGVRTQIFRCLKRCQLETFLCSMAS